MDPVTRKVTTTSRDVNFYEISSRDMQPLIIPFPAPLEDQNDDTKTTTSSPTKSIPEGSSQVII